MPPPIKKLADRFLTEPSHIEVARPAAANALITQRLVESTVHGKRDTPPALLRDGVTNAIIFAHRKTTVRAPAASLMRHGFAAGQIHGDWEKAGRAREVGKAAGREKK